MRILPYTSGVKILRSSASPMLQNQIHFRANNFYQLLPAKDRRQFCKFYVSTAVLYSIIQVPVPSKPSCNEKPSERNIRFTYTVSSHFLNSNFEFWLPCVTCDPIDQSYPILSSIRTTNSPLSLSSIPHSITKQPNLWIRSVVFRSSQTKDS